MGGLKAKTHPDLIVGLGTSDDAGVFRITPDIALIQTLDFLTPVTDDPYAFGQIAAANSLSDVYAMGGTPLPAMNIVCFPSEDLPESVLQETLQGGLDKIHESGATLVGGHSVDDPEFKYGLSVTGVVHPDRVLTNHGIRTGDRILLTKPVGTGIVATAVKAKLADAATTREMVKIMATLNRGAAEIMARFDVGGCTDVTGFGLAGHLLEMARGGRRHISLFTRDVPIIANAKNWAAMGMVPGGAYRNRKYSESGMEIPETMDKILVDLMFDPQTSGGLLISLKKNQVDECLSALKDNGIGAALVGEVMGDHTCGKVTLV
ncbi:selenide, water dikinase SelD [Desulfocicer niacini]